MLTPTPDKKRRAATDAQARPALCTPEFHAWLKADRARFEEYTEAAGVQRLEDGTPFSRLGTCKGCRTTLCLPYEPEAR